MSSSCDAGSSTPNVAISKSKFTPLVVSKNEVVGVNVHKVTLDFPQSTDILGMTTAGMLMVEGNKRDGSGKIARPYTPVSRNNMVGKLELVAKDTQMMMLLLGASSSALLGGIAARSAVGRAGTISANFGAPVVMGTEEMMADKKTGR